MTYEVKIKDNKGNPIQGAIVRIDILDDGKTFARSSDGEGYTNISFVPSHELALISVIADNYKTYSAYISSIPITDQQLEIVLSFKNPVSWHPAQEAYTNFRGAFCIPNAFTDIPYGDGKRIWTPAFGCYTQDWQNKIIQKPKDRGYNWFVYQLSGNPYGNDYPTLDLDIDRITHDLNLLHKNELGTIITFNSDGSQLDLSYLKEVASRTQNLVDIVMGIWELDEIVDRNEDKVINVLKQQHDLWPNAVNAFHSSPQNNNAIGFGERSFWLRAVNEAFVDIYFLQQKAWDRPLEDVADRANDFSIRLQGPKAFWVQLKYGMCLFEETTTVTYHQGKSEDYAIGIMDQLMGMIRPRPIGYMDSGSV